VKIDATFVRSAAGAADFPRDGLTEVALVGRSNVGKSRLINALLRRRVARTSAAPGKTRLVNIFRVDRGRSEPFYMVDLPGYGYARGGSGAFSTLTEEYFGSDRDASLSALLLIDARHPGLDSDLKAWGWLTENVERAAIVATKIDKLARGERIRAQRVIESAFHDSVLPVSAVTGEGLEELWKLIDKLANNPRLPKLRRSRRRALTDPPPLR
jgi:GTP-binding protein